MVRIRVVSGALWVLGNLGLGALLFLGFRCGWVVLIVFWCVCDFVAVWVLGVLWGLV